MKENELLTFNGGEVSTWKSFKRKTFDSKRFQREEPELYNDFLVENSYRQFRVKL